MYEWEKVAAFIWFNGYIYKKKLQKRARTRLAGVLHLLSKCLLFNLGRGLNPRLCPNPRGAPDLIGGCVRTPPPCLVVLTRERGAGFDWGLLAPLVRWNIWLDLKIYEERFLIWEFELAGLGLGLRLFFLGLLYMAYPSHIHTEFISLVSSLCPLRLDNWHADDAAVEIHSRKHGIDIESDLDSQNGMWASET